MAVCVPSKRSAALLLLLGLLLLACIRALPISLWDIFYDICESIEDRYIESKYGWADRRTYKYPYKLSYPPPVLATQKELASMRYVPRPEGAPVFRHQLIDESCPRFVTYGLCAGCGIGHKAAEYLFGVRLANLMNATFVIESSKWHYTKHGDLGWADKMLGLMDGEHTLEDVQSRYDLWWIRPCPIDSPRKPHDYGCNVLYYAPRYPGCCKNTGSYGSLTCEWSPFSYQIFSEHAPMLKAKYSAAAGTRDVSVVKRYFQPTAINVAWHIRVGDWNPHEGHSDHYLLVAKTLSEAFAGLPVHYYFFSYQDMTRGNKPPAGFEFLEGLLPNTKFISDTDTAETHALMISADVLIGSGSGMLTLPSIYSEGLVIYHERLRFPDMMDEMAHWVRLYVDGTMDADVHSLRAQLITALCATGRNDQIGIQCT